MARAKLMKAVLLGVCISAFTTGIAYAQSIEGAGASPAYYGEVSAEVQALIDRQAEIDKVLFKEELYKKLEEKGIKVYYTGINVDVVEIAIAPYTDENAAYLYDVFGKEDVEVVAGSDSILYMTTEVVAPDEVLSTTEGVAPDEVLSYGGADMDVPVSDGDLAHYSEVVDEALVDPRDGAVEEGDFEIQIESIPEEAAELKAADDVMYTTTAEDSAEEIRTIAATGYDVVNADAESAKEGIPTPAIVLAIAGGAALIGGVVIVSKKNKALK